MRKGICSVDGCDRPVTCRGWCKSHYYRWSRTGSPTGSYPPRRPARPRADRFRAKVDNDGPVPEGRPDLGVCWLWMGKRDRHGYGEFFISKRQTVRAHRFSYELAIGPIPHGLVLDHLCRVRHCVNPAHLEPVTNAENVRRGETGRGSSRGPTCRNGHVFPVDAPLSRAGRWRSCPVCKRERNARYAAKPQK